MTRSLDPGARRRRLPLAVLAVLAVLAAALGVAAEIERRVDDDVVVAAGETVPDDLYAAGEIVRVEGTVRGDLVAVGREVIVVGTVEGDLIAAGELVAISGTVGDDVRIAGQVLHLGRAARVGDDLVAAGFSLEARPGSSVAGTVIAAGYQGLLAGSVGESLRGAFAALAIAGAVERDVEVEVGARGERPPPTGELPIPVPAVASGLTLAAGARIGGDLRYESPDAAEVAAGATVEGEVVHRREPGEAVPTAADRVLDALRRLVALLLVGGLLLLVAPRWLAGLAAAVRARPLPSLGWGLVLLIAAAAAVLALALVTVLFAVPLGLLGLGGLAAGVVALGVVAELALVLGAVLVAAYLPAVVVGLAGGRPALARGGGPTRGRLFAALALGAAVLALLGMVPYLGALIGVLVTLAGLGALWTWAAGRRRRARAEAAPAVST